MTTATGPSAYPFDLSELLPRARELAETLGGIPSRNRLIKELRIGAPKATALREALAELTTAPSTAPLYGPVRIPTSTPPEAAPDPTSATEPTPAPAESATAALPAPVVPPAEAVPLATGDEDPVSNITTPAGTADSRSVRKPRSWPVWLLALPAFVAIWSGWVGLGELTGFGVVHPLPGIWDRATLNTAITLPIGVETYAAYALAVWLAGTAPAQARRFARWSAIGSLVFGAAGQVAYHLLAAAHVTAAPVPVTVLVACLPVAVLGMGAALAHLIHANHQ